MGLSAWVTAELEQALTGPITVDITTIGRRSGTLRRIEIWIVNVDGRIVIGGTPRARDWMANLRAEPHLTVHFKQTVFEDVPATAREVLDPGVRAEIYTHRSTEWYRQNSTAEQLIEGGPTVELTLHS